MRKTWYDVRAAAGNAPAVISIYDEIGMWGVTAKDFITDLAAVSGSAITLNINSPGGSVFDALTIFNALKKCGKTVNVCVMGIAASAASYIAMAGDKISMPENTFMMVHNPLNGIYGNADDMREMADVLDKIGNSLVATYVARSGLPEQDVRDLLNKDSYLTAAECVDLGFADEMTPAITAKASFEREHLPANIQALFQGEPPAEEVPEPEEAEEVEATFAEQVQALVTAADLAEYVPVLLLDPALDTTDKVRARIAEAREIKSLCAVAKVPEMANKFISSRKTLAESRAVLCDNLAKSDDQAGVDTTQSSNTPKNNAPASAVVTPAGVWAKRESKPVKNRS